MSIKIGISQGDTNGIGGEVIFKSLSDEALYKEITPVVYCHKFIFDFYKSLLPRKILENVVIDYRKIIAHTLNIQLLETNNSIIEFGKITKEGGENARKSLIRATKDLKDNVIDAIVTAPVNKQNFSGEGFDYIGHTAFFDEQFGKGKSLMTMIGKHLKITALTDHIPLADVPKNINPAILKKKILTFQQSLKYDFGITEPQIAVLGLNPHASDNGKMGREEQETIEPVIRSLDTNISGTYSPDAFFGRKTYKKFDGIFALYHDQMLIPFKMLEQENGVNYTAGLPIVRTSPVHGTAMDIAGKNRASSSSMREAIKLAREIFIKN